MTRITRRSLSFGLAAAAAAFAAAPQTGMAQSDKSKVALPTISRRKVGNVAITALSDGFVDIPIGVFTGAPTPEIEAAFAKHFARRADGTHRLGFTQWLVDDGERLVLIDSGYAGATKTTGHLAGILSVLGVEPKDIDAVLITHMHDDHTSGLVTAEGQAAFPDADVFIHRDDVAYFSDDTRAASAPDILKRSFAVGKQVAALPKLQAYDGERSFTPAISAVDLRGHTPGHMGYRISDGGESLIIVGDALFHPAIHPARTDIGIAFEPDPAAAAQMRRRLFPRAAEEQALLAATHMPFPGFGRILREKEALAWAPADWELSG
jgi:glyoxylase-like metal-dependent hydrolase (beta-lactamase superfamily II)